MSAGGTYYAYGGDSRAVQDQLRNVQKIQANRSAFAAILDDGSVVSWGTACMGGNSTAVQQQLKKVQQIHASEGAFAAILGDGSVVTWGDPDAGGDSSAVQSQLKNVQQIEASSRAFAASLADGSVVTWGDAYYGGGPSSAMQHRLNNAKVDRSSLRQQNGERWRARLATGTGYAASTDDRLILSGSKGPPNKGFRQQTCKLAWWLYRHYRVQGVKVKA